MKFLSKDALSNFVSDKKAKKNKNAFARNQQIKT